MALTFQQEVSDGVRTLYSVGFEYISQNDVYVYTGLDTEYETQVTYRWVDSSTIELLNMLEVPAGTSFRIRRVMDRVRLIHEFENKSIRGKLVDIENKHALFLMQEVTDGFLVLSDVLNMRFPVNMQGYALTGLPEATETDEALPFGQAEETYVNVTGDVMQAPLKGPVAASTDDYTPYQQVSDLIDNRLLSYDPNDYEDWGLVTQAVNDTDDYGSI